MRFAGNFHPEWGSVAPAPSLMHTARIVVVAAAIGATAGAGVVLSLTGDPPSEPLMSASGNTVVVVRSLVQPAEAVVTSASGDDQAGKASNVTAGAAIAATAKASASPSVQARTQQNAADPSNPGPPNPAPTRARAAAPIASDSRAQATAQMPAAVEALAESPPVVEAAPPQPIEATTLVPAAAAPKPVPKKPPSAAHEQQPQRSQPFNVATKRRGTENSDTGFGSLLRHIFSARAGSPYSQN